jgi:pyruvate dehydrogenase E1 component alpha subunit
VTEDKLRTSKERPRARVGQSADFARSSPEPELPGLYTDILVEQY